MPKRRSERADHGLLARAIDLAARLLLGLALRLPYRWRVPLFGWLTSRILSPLAGYPARIRANLRHAWPEMPAEQVRKLVRAVPDNWGRTLIEIYSGPEFLARLAEVTPEGPGADQLAQDLTEGRPIVVVGGHFGNYDAFRGTLALQGHAVGALYRPMNNPYFNDHYTAAMASVAQPIFPRGRKGMAQMLKHLRAGQTLALLSDQYYGDGAPLSFFGQPAPTALSAAEMALKYGARLYPIHGLRQSDGLNFRVLVDAPIPEGTAEEMMQAFNDALEVQVRAHPEQWLWIHRRWKPERQRRNAAANDRN